MRNGCDDDWIEAEAMTGEEGGNDNSQTITQTVWLYMLSSGEWYMASDLVARFPYFTAKIVSNIVWCMAVRDSHLAVRKVISGATGFREKETYASIGRPPTLSPKPTKLIKVPEGVFYKYCVDGTCVAPKATPVRLIARALEIRKRNGKEL